MEWLFTLDPAVAAAIYTAVGAVILKVVEKILSSRISSIERNRDYRDEIKSLQDRLDKVESDLDSARERYIRATEEVLTLKAMLISHGIQVDD